MGPFKFKQFNLVKQKQIELKSPLGYIQENSLWLAGFMEADGSIGLTKESRPDRGKWLVRREISVGQRELPLIKAVSDFLPVPSDLKPRFHQKTYRVAYRGLTSLIPWIEIMDRCFLQGLKFDHLQAIKQSIKISLTSNSETREVQTHFETYEKTKQDSLSSRRLNPCAFSYNFTHGKMTLEKMDQIDDCVKQIQTQGQLFGRDKKALAKRFGISDETLRQYLNDRKAKRQKLKLKTQFVPDRTKTKPRPGPLKYFTLPQMLEIDQLLIQAEKDKVNKTKPKRITDIKISQMYNVSRQTVNVYKLNATYYKNIMASNTSDVSS